MALFPSVLSTFTDVLDGPVQTGLGPFQPPLQWVPCLSRNKAVGKWRLPPTQSSADVEESVQLYT